MNLAIIGAGGIAEKMALTVNKMNDVTCFAIASRDIKKAEEFAGKFGFKKAYGSYEELVNDNEIDLVYIATPHSHHYQHIKLCLENGRNVLCEKAFTANARQAKEVIELAHEKKCLLTEAIWTRYMPSAVMINEILGSGIIGAPSSLTANIGYPIADKPRLAQPSLAGGALLDIGIYPINFAFMVFGTDIKNVVSTAVITPAGVDNKNSITITYNDGRQAVLHSNACARTDRRGVIYASKGYMEIDNINNCRTISLYSNDGELTGEYTVPPQISGYEYEVLSCMKAISEGRIECPEMTHDKTIFVMEFMDKLRYEWGVRYPFDQN
ncbi:MAG: Gfo/Idh/MocA family oxidoreductase [Oscillospiraceae bacterium]|nr:Gfo/Idh/MocA family oxidoreductase [Oscillospiraceae bacterium]